MNTAVILFVALCSVCFHCYEGAPRPSNKENLEKSIANFLRHDTQLVKELEQFGYVDRPSTLNRAKRQSEFEDGLNDADDDDKPKEPGFFDRAAKFVVEILQRFLKWINSDSN